MTQASPAEYEVAKLIVDALKLEVSPEEILPGTTLFEAQEHGGGAAQGESLGLDSIDALEIAMAISQRYGFQLKSDDAENHKIFATLRSLTAHIEKNRMR